MKKILISYLIGLVSFLSGLFFLRICFYEMGIMLLIFGLGMCWTSIPLPRRGG